MMQVTNKTIVDVLFCSLTLVFLFCFLAYLCDQRKWKDEIQDITIKGITLEVTIMSIKL